jgi:transcriptional regulator GlxA family with amidase domain
MAKLKANARARPGLTPNGKGVIDVTVVLLDGGYASTAIAPIEVFHSAGSLWNWLHGEAEQPRFRVRTASLDGKKISSLYPLVLTPQMAIKDVKHADIIVIPASVWSVQDPKIRKSGLLPWLRKWHARGAYIASICSGVAFVAEAGLLDGRRATTHWGVADSLCLRYPQVDWQPEYFVTEDSRVLCSGGVYAAVDLSLYLVEKFCGHEVALQTAKSLLLSMPRSRQLGYSVVPLSRPHSDDKVKSVEDYLRDHFDRDLSLEKLAARVGMSPRNFIRRFKTATGRLPNAYIQLLRISAAKDMLERGASSVQDVCRQIGYEDIAFFRNLFKRHTGMTPGEYRENFAGMSFDRGQLANRNSAAP